VALRRLWRCLLTRPWVWLILLLWPAVVLLGVLTPLTVCFCGSSAAASAQVAAIASAVVALALLGLIVARSYRGVRAIRNLLFGGEYEAALDLVRHNAPVGFGFGFESALERLIEFDRRRAERVAASTRLIDSLLHEAPVPILVGDLEESLLRFSRAMCDVFGIADDRFSLLSILLHPPNGPFARLWATVAGGESSQASAVLTLHVPSRRVARVLEVQLFAVQDDEGMILYVLGFARRPAAPPPPPAPPEGPKQGRRARAEEDEGSHELPQE